MKKLLTTASLCLTFAFALTACKASEADCEKLGDKIVELTIKDAKDQGLPEDLLKSAAEAGKAEVVKQCKAEPPTKSEVDCALKAESIDALTKCEGA